MVMAQKSKRRDNVVDYTVTANLLRFEKPNPRYFRNPEIIISEDGKEAYIRIGLRDKKHVIEMRLKFNKKTDIKRIMEVLKETTNEMGEFYKGAMVDIEKELKREKGRGYKLSGRGLAAAIRSAVKNNCYVYNKKIGNSVLASDYLKYGTVVDAVAAKTGKYPKNMPVQYVEFKESDVEVQPIIAYRSKPANKQKITIEVGEIKIERGGRKKERREVKISVGKIKIRKLSDEEYAKLLKTPKKTNKKKSRK